jgi:hypothetical protein
MRVTYQLTKKDVIDATGNKALSLIGLFLVVVGAISISIRAIAFGPGLALVAIGLLFTLGRRLQVASMFRRDKHLSGPAEALIETDFLQISSPNSHEEHPLASVHLKSFHDDLSQR